MYGYCELYNNSPLRWNNHILDPSALTVETRFLFGLFGCIQNLLPFVWNRVWPLFATVLTHKLKYFQLRIVPFHQQLLHHFPSDDC